MKKHTAHLLFAAASSLLLTSPATQAAQTLTEGLQSGSSIKVNFRTRYEEVSWDGLKDSDALTLRTRLSYQSGTWNGFAATIEMDNVTEVDNDVGYRTWARDTKNPGTAIISDPEGTDLNQSLVSYSTFNNQVKYGRQRIVLDNSRFIGNVGWRQNEQTYDGLSFTNKSIRYTNIFLAHITNVNRIFGDDIPIQGDYKQDSNLVNVSYTGFSAGKLTGYAYLIDNDNDAVLVKAADKAAALSSNTYGVRWVSSANPAFMYTLECATQESAYDNPLDYSARYVLAEVSTTLGRFVPAVGYELLGSDSGMKGFATPFATLHAFQGWADRFLTTPKNGIEDMYVNLGSTVWGTQLLASYHTYKSDVKDVDYGTEWNVSASKKWGAVAYTIKYAAFKNDNFKETIAGKSIASDTAKFWVQADWNF
ncbi:MAG TPA: alginate export family protein [Cellvibrio sp.]|nr:alginate export family protein [Cellvibrio sp.]